MSTTVGAVLCRTACQCLECGRGPVRNRHAQTRLRLWRVDNGVSLPELSDLTGLSAPFLSRVERGERQLAPLTKVQVARRLGVPIHELFEVEEIDEEEPPE
jgi:transcriptional regulator with XRE-family HTH domain